MTMNSVRSGRLLSSCAKFSKRPYNELSGPSHQPVSSSVDLNNEKKDNISSYGLGPLVHDEQRMFGQLHECLRTLDVSKDALDLVADTRARIDVSESKHSPFKHDTINNTIIITTSMSLISINTTSCHSFLS